MIGASRTQSLLADADSEMDWTAATMETSADDTAVLLPSSRLSPSDTSTSHLLGLESDVEDARDFHRRKLGQTRRPSTPEDSKRKGLRVRIHIHQLTPLHLLSCGNASGDNNDSLTWVKQISMSTVVCHDCFTRNSPKWRTGPDGPGSLCNVCGLLRAQRERKKNTVGVNAK